MGPEKCIGCETCGTLPVDDGHRYIYENEEAYKKYRGKYIEMWKDHFDFKELPEEMTWPRPEPHEFVTEQVITDNGEQPLTTCRMCDGKKSEI